LRSTARSFNEQNTQPGAELLTTHSSLASNKRQKKSSTNDKHTAKQTKQEISNATIRHPQTMMAKIGVTFL
jgi:hypothetical protein